MKSTVMMWTVWAALTGLWLLAVSYKLFLFRKSLRMLSHVQLQSSPTVWPKVSLIVPACNESITIGAAANTLLAMDYPNLELIIIDDRSTDGTGEVIAELAARDNRVKAISITTLPVGWLGKVHALHQGALHATGEWLLFSDADVHYAPTALKKAVAFSTSNDIDFLCVIPQVESHLFSMRVAMTSALHWACVGIDVRRAEDPQKPDCVGGGAFNMARKTTFERTRGWSWLRMEVLDDGAIAYELKAAGARHAILSGLDELKIEWYPSVWSFVRGLEKNGFSIFEYNVAAVLGFYTLVILIFLGYTVVPILSETPWVMIFTWATLLMYLSTASAALRRVMRTPGWYVIFLPITFILLPLILLRSMTLCLLRQGIRWRGTFYSLAELRRGQRLKLVHLVFRRPTKSVM